MTKVFVGNIAFTIPKEEIRSLFERYGKVANFDMPPRKGYAFVEYEDDRDAEDAIAAMREYNLEGRQLRVELSTGSGKKGGGGGSSGGAGASAGAGAASNGNQSRNGPTGSSRMPTRHLYVAGIPPAVGEDTLKRHFARYGEVESIRLLPNRRGGDKSGFVDFLDQTSAEDAYKNGTTLDGGAVLRFDYNEPKGRPRSGNADSSSRTDSSARRDSFSSMRNPEPSTRDPPRRSADRGYERDPVRTRDTNDRADTRYDDRGYVDRRDLKDERRVSSSHDYRRPVEPRSPEYSRYDRDREVSRSGYDDRGRYDSRRDPYPAPSRYDSPVRNGRDPPPRRDVYAADVGRDRYRSDRDSGSMYDRERERDYRAPPRSQPPLRPVRESPERRRDAWRDDRRDPALRSAPVSRDPYPSQPVYREDDRAGRRDDYRRDSYRREDPLRRELETRRDDVRGATDVREKRNWNPPARNRSMSPPPVREPEPELRRRSRSRSRSPSPFL